MNFDKNGKLIVKTCACGVSELGNILVHSINIKSQLGERDIIYSPVILSRKCAKKYHRTEANLKRENCLSYNPSENFREPKILVADDEPFILSMLPMVLNGAGYNNITAVNNGQKALNELLNAHYDLLITDNNMPGLFGYEVIQQYKASPKVNGTKFVAMSGDFADQQLSNTYISLGAAVISKPFLPSDLISIVNSSISKE